MIRTATDPRRVRWALIAGLAVLTAVTALMFGHLMDTTVATGPTSVSTVTLDQSDVVPDVPAGESPAAVALLMGGCAALCLTLGIGCLLAVLALARIGAMRLLFVTEAPPLPPRSEAGSPTIPLALTQLGVSRI